MDWLFIALRIVHIFTGVAWVGGAALFFFYIEPTINTLGPDAERFVDELVNQRKVPIYFLSASTLNILFGLLLYWRDSGGLQLSWIESPTGLAFTIAGVSAVIAWAGGNVLIPRLLIGLGRIGAQLRAAGGPPSPELLGAMRATQERLRTVGMIDLVLLGVAVLGMATARYLA